MGGYLYGIGTALSQLANALIGGEPDETLSLRIGQSMDRGGLASRIPMPVCIRQHFVRVAWRAARR